jgi:hypothetical protein
VGVTHFEKDRLKFQTAFPAWFRLSGIRMSIDAIGFVRRHGVVLESAKGPVPNLAEAVARTPIRGSWWTHPDGKKIFRATRLVRSSEHVLVCRLVEGKVTYVDRELWPAVVRLARYFGKEALTAIREEHSASGEHRIKTLPFPKWVPLSARERAKAMSEAEAAAQLGAWVTAPMRHHNSRSSRKYR